MSFQRIRRQKSDRFTSIDNTILRDRTISLKAKGLMATVMGLPDDWDFSVAGMVKILREGRTAIYAAIKELEAAGYVVIERQYVNGKIASWDYLFCERPQKLLSGFLEVENLEVENQQQYKKQRKEETMDIPNPVDPFPEPDWDYPMKELVEAFPYIQFQSNQIGFVECTVKDSPLDRAAWSATIDIYRMNYDPTKGRYLPDKIANLLGVFTSTKSRMEKENASTRRPAITGKKQHGNRSTEDVLKSIGADPKSFM